MYPQLTSMNSNLEMTRSLPKRFNSNEDNINNVLAYFYEYSTTIHNAEKDLGALLASVQRILANHEMSFYNFTKVQILKQKTVAAECVFAKTF